MNNKVEKEVMIDDQLKESLMMKDKWIRLFFMVVYAMVNYVVQMLIWALAAVQFIFVLFTSKPNENLLRFSAGLTDFSYHIIRYLAYNVEEKPFPFSGWHKTK